LDNSSLQCINLNSIETRYSELYSSVLRTPTTKLSSPFLSELIKESEIYTET